MSLRDNHGLDVSILDISTDQNPGEGRRTSHGATAQASERRLIARAVGAFHPAISFLSAYGVTPDALVQASAQARAAGIRPERAMLASGIVTAEHFYRSLARHLGLEFIEDDRQPDGSTNFP